IQVVDAAFSPDGKRAVSVHLNGTLFLWNTATGQLEKQLAHGQEAHTACFSPDGRRLLAYGMNASLWEVTTGKRLALFSHPRLIWAAAFSPDGRKVITTDVEGNVQTWDGQTGARLPFAPKHDAGLFAAEYSPDGQTLLTAGAEGKAHLWSAATGQPAGAPIMLDTPISHARFSPRGAWIVTLNYTKGTVHVWEAGNNKFAAIQPDLGGPALALSPTDQLAAVSVHPDQVALVDLRTSKRTSSLLPHSAPVVAAVFNTRGHLLTACKDRSMHLWDAGQGTRVGSAWTHSIDKAAPLFFPDGVHVRLGNEIRQAQTGELLGRLELEGSPVLRADQRVLVAKVTGNLVRVFDGLTGTPVSPEIKTYGIIMSAELSPDGTRLLYGGVNAVAWIADVNTGAEVVPEMHHHEQIFRVVYGPRGEHALTADFKKRYRLWKAATGAAVNWEAQGDIGFTTDGRLLWHIDKQSLRFWHAATGKPMGPVLSLRRPVRNVHVSADGWLREQSTDGSLSLQDLHLRLARGKSTDLSRWVETVTGLRLDKNDIARSIQADEWQGLRAQEAAGP
ncbi:MAG: WD40 repeat domain-containing protein, partial [Gemmataceae bacterium]